MLNFIYDSLYSLPVTIALLSIFNVYISYTATTPVEYVIAICFTLFFTGIKSMKMKWRTISITATVIGTILFLSLLATPDNREIFNKYSYIGIVVLISLLGFFATVLIQKASAIRYCTALGMLVLLALYMINKNAIHSLDVAFMLIYILLIIAELIQKNAKHDNNDIKQHTIGIASFIIIGITLALARPASRNPYDWEFAIKLYNMAHAKYIKIIQSLPSSSFGNSFESNIAAYSDFATIHSAIAEADDDKVVLTFKPFSGTKASRYLQGNTFDTFDGQKWNQTFTDTQHDMLIDAAEMTYQVFKHDLHASKCIYMTHADITYKNLKTRHLFVPEKTINVLENKTRIDYITENGANYFHEEKGVDTKYNISYMNLYPLNNYLIEKIESEHYPIDESFNYYFANKRGYGQLSWVTYDQLLARRDMIYKHYADVPEISDRTRAYLDEVTKDATSDFDKLLCIKDALNEFPYTLEVDDYPKNIHSEKDFLDYFLFQEQKGYCMYYATAFALLARAEGFPSRYVQGYHLRLNGSREIEVYESNAHAWVQVYINDFGWILFDATPGYGNPVIYDTDSVSQNSTVSENSTSSVSANEPEIPDQYKDLMNNSNNNDSSLDLSDYQEKTNRNLLRMIIMITIGSVLILLLFIILIERFIINRRFTQMNNHDKVLTICKENIRLLRALNYKLDTGNTLEELNILASRELPDADLRFIEIYEHCIYSDHIPDNDELEIVISGNICLMNILKTKKYYFRYVIAKISSYR